MQKMMAPNDSITRDCNARLIEVSRMKISYAPAIKNNKIKAIKGDSSISK